MADHGGRTRRPGVRGRAGAATSRIAGSARRAVRLARRLRRRLASRLPGGRSARTRRLLRTGLGGCRRCLVIGPTSCLRQALPAASLDVVGTSPDRFEVNVVSEALGEGSLPRRWGCVVVTDVDPPAQRVTAAVSACSPGGVVAVLTSPSRTVPQLLAAGTTTTLRARGVRLVLARLPG